MIDKRDRPESAAEIVVTPAMAAAGADELIFFLMDLCSGHSEGLTEIAASSIFRRMTAQAKLSESPIEDR